MLLSIYRSDRTSDARFSLAFKEVLHFGQLVRSPDNKLITKLEVSDQSTSSAATGEINHYTAH